MKKTLPLDQDYIAFIPLKTSVLRSSIETDLDGAHKRNSTFSLHQNRNSSFSSIDTSLENNSIQRNKCTYFSFYGLNTPQRPKLDPPSLTGPFRFSTLPLPPLPDTFADRPELMVSRTFKTHYQSRSLKGFPSRLKKLELDIDVLSTISEALIIRNKTFWASFKTKFREIPLFVDECRYAHERMALQNSMTIFLVNLGQAFLGAPFSPLRICRFDKNFLEARNGHETSMALADRLEKSYCKIKADMIGLRDTCDLYEKAKDLARLIESQFSRMFKKYGHSSKPATKHLIPQLEYFEKIRLSYLDTDSARSLDEWTSFFSEMTSTFTAAEKLYKETKQDQASATKKYKMAVQMKKVLRQTTRQPGQCFDAVPKQIF